jgi:hypothetical protein
LTGDKMAISTEKPQRTNSAFGIIIVIIVVAAMIGIWLLKSQSSANGAIRQITYQVEASGGYAQIIYTDSNGNNTEAAIVTTPFFKTINIPVGRQVYLTASNPSQTGDVVCKIKINNRDWKESRGTHPIDSVACGGIIK